MTPTTSHVLRQLQVLLLVPMLRQAPSRQAAAVQGLDGGGAGVGGQGARGVVDGAAQVPGGTTGQ